jgi:hypothetical protein
MCAPGRTRQGFVPEAFMTHEELCERALRWLRGTRRCNVALHGIASTSEVPDAIGWSTSRHWYGSTLVECKTSVADFLGDKQKYIRYRHPQHHWQSLRGKNGAGKRLMQEGWMREVLETMGRYRYFLVPSGLVQAQDVANHYPDHGLLWLNGKIITEVRKAPEREKFDYDSEIRLLQFALVHVEKNLMSHQLSVDMTTLTKYFGRDGITFPSEQETREMKADGTI